jgi:hypothetical protein
MKQNKTFLKKAFMGVLVISLLGFTKCINSSEAPANCNGYTGSVTNKNASALLKICHFMPKDTIAVWSARYQRNKANINSTTLPNTGAVLSDSCSFNNSIVRAIITNDSCIGLRVVYGMDEKNKVHVILVGIKPDYSTLYVRKPADCGTGAAAEKGLMQKYDDGDDDDLGGGEMGQEP